MVLASVWKEVDGRQLVSGILEENSNISLSISLESVGGQSETG